MSSQFSYMSNAHPEYIESIYEDYQKDPDKVDPEWARFFEGFEFAMARFGEDSQSLSPKELQVWSLIEAYRQRGHLEAKTNPIRERKDRHARLNIEEFGLDKNDLKNTFIAGKELGLSNPTLENIIEFLRKIYCKAIGIEYTYIEDVDVRNWIRDKFEKGSDVINLPVEKKKRILKKLNDTVVFENFLNTKYIGQKRFSLEGGESFIPGLDAIINESAEGGTEEVVIGMAHRGRLNVLANVLGKTYEHIFSEFEGTAVPDLTMGDGDVKYHLGYSSIIETATGKLVHLKLSPNPSHLEAVNPVVQGFTRAKADILYNSEYDKILPILVHGDAALPGQGVGFEVIQMSKLKGYETGGSIHFVINNQIGFTTDFDDARSSTYSTGVAAVVQAPVLHVNGDDVEAVVYAAEFAAQFRQKFNTDIFIDMVCYRKHGHNEGDEPKFTQPTLYKAIENHKNPRELYIETLMEKGTIDKKEAEELNQEFWDVLQERQDKIKQNTLPYKYQDPERAWKELRKSEEKDFEKSPKTSITEKTLKQILKQLQSTPEDFKPLRKVERLLKSSQKLIDNGQMDWALAELTAYGSILLEGNDVRMSGQDVKRGTFSHRHAILYDETNSKEYNRLNYFKEDQGMFRIYNSLLSEFGVLGFEFGYSMASPNTLTIWEAQFGDFCNGAQTIIDQFITSSESKWQRMSGLVMLLPHGYAGQGPEHSSARLERFLLACAEFNITVANCTTPANFFHILRRQLERPFRKPLIIMSPKSLLRHSRCISDFADFTKNGFRELIDDENVKAADVKKVLFCSGKIYYELLEKQEEDKRKDIAIVRLEQLYPLPYKQMDALIKKYKKAKFLWVQEEPSNKGAWVYMLSCYRDIDWELVSRKASASPATGYNKIHVEEQEAIINKAFE
ncbi:MAG: 2-oxoglutarate dehydrogenase E1 component [Chitinophagales bacterium]